MSFKTFVANTLRRLGYQLYRIEDIRPFAHTLKTCLANPILRELNLSTVIDVGASDGRWSREVQPFLPNSRFLLVEANPVHEPALKRLCSQGDTFHFELKAASDQTGDIFFNDEDPFGGIAAKTEQAGGRKHPATTIDDAVAAHNLSGPFLLKLDTHGFEVPIIEGASKTLKNTSALIVEVYNFRIQEFALRFHEMIQFLEGKGFRPVEAFDISYRPCDGALWQMDILFLRTDHPAFSFETYQPPER